ncbi:uncharacterized protein [Primulina eburnea]|uniref:uncharacterized protein n=1 Tax=Primulina eburnea TaxID=1245227 RepID=UPI003C6C11B7
MQCRDKSATSKWIAKKYEKQIKSAQGMIVGDLGSAFIDDYGVHVDVCKLHKARKKVTKKYMSDHEVSYKKLPKYAKVLRKYNSGVTYKILCEGLDLCNPNCNPIFKRFFVSFVAQREGFVNGCRPFIGVDGCFLKNPFGGQLLCAVTLDANSSIFPIAVMISEGENQVSWEYFLDCLHWHLGDERYLTFMSDRQKGLINATKKIYPNAKHRYCAWHRYNNFKSLFPGPKFRSKFWAAVKATNVFDFNDIMDEIKQENTAAWNWLMQEEPFHWSRHAFDIHVKNDHVTNNMSESFNSELKVMRQNPILTLLEHIRRKLMKRFCERQQNAMTWNSIVPPKVESKLSRNFRESRQLHGFESSEHLFEISDGKWFVVNLNSKTCEYGEWQISRVPCKHAIFCINHIRDDPMKYVDNFLTKAAYLRTYESNINAIPDESMWEDENYPKMIVRKKESKRGRPKLKRIKGANESLTGKKIRDLFI